MRSLLSMNDPIQEFHCSIPTLQQWGANHIVLMLIGALFAAIGGFVANILKLRLENKQEIKCIKVSLIDEIDSLSNCISKMIETQKTSKILNKIYLDELRENIDSFNVHKSRLFLIGDKKTRNDLRQFYKDLITEVSKSLESSVAGTLNDNDMQHLSRVKEAVDSFAKIENQAKNLKSTLDSYKYKVLWIV